MLQPKTEEALLEYGESMRRNRVLLGYSVREAAEKAGVSKNTILRIEAGLPVQKATFVKLARAFGMVPTDPATKRPAVTEGKYYKLQSADEAIWYATTVNKSGEAEASTNDELASQAERNRMGWYGLATHFGRPLRCRRANSHHIPFLVEVFAPTDVTAGPGGERFMYVLRGAVRVNVGDESFVLSEGGAATYDSTLPNGLEPLEPVLPGKLAPLVLQIVVLSP